jgi:lipid-binding SYLF domain-containing protein
MMTLALISLLVGMVLGQRFRVLVLIPAFAIGLALTIGAGIVGADAAWSTALMAAVTTISLQIGYFAGIGIRRLTVAVRASRLRIASPAGSAPTRRPAH